MATYLSQGAASLRVCCIFVCLLLLLSCKPGVPSGILSESKMEAVLYDYHLAQGAAENAEGDMYSNRYLYIQSVFQKHGITEADFDSSMVWYSSHPELLYKMYIRLGDRFDSEARSLGLGVSDTELYANMSDIGDTANIWSGSRMLVLECNRTNNLRTLNIMADSTFMPGDDYKLSLSSTLLGECREAYLIFTVTYRDKKTSSSVMHLTSNPHVMLELPKRTDCEDYETERISITFYVPLNSQRVVSGYLCVNRPALLRMHRVQMQGLKAKDSIQTDMDSVAVDSLDSLSRDSTFHDLRADSVERLTPEEMRNRKIVKKQIDITNERPVLRQRPRQSVRRSSPLR